MKEKEYQAYCRKTIENFLSSTLMNCDPMEMDDATIILDADARSKAWTHEGNGYLSQTAHFCSLMKVDGIVTNLYEPDTYVEVLQMHPMNYEGNSRIEIPFNHFQYPMTLDKGQASTYDGREAKYVCLFDDKHDKEAIFEACSSLVLFSHYLGGITKFNQRRFLYRIVSVTRETLTDTIRKEIVKAQYSAIEYLSKYPEYCRPESSHFGITYLQAGNMMRTISMEYAQSIEQVRHRILQSIGANRIAIESI